MAKGNPNPSPATRFSKAYQPSPDKRVPAWSIQHALRRLMAQEIAPGVTHAQAVAQAHLRRALEGDMPAVKEAYDRIDGKTVDKQALTDAEGHDVQLDDRAFAVWLASKLGKSKPGKG